MGKASFASRAVALCGASALGALALLSSAPATQAAEFCLPGEGAGQCALAQRVGAQRGLAVDTESGRLYVADEANNRVNVFEADGDFLFAFGWKVNATTPEEKLQTCTAATGCQKGTAGSGPGQLDRPTEVAVDNDPASPSHHALYVTDSMTSPQNLRVQKFDPTSLPVEFVWMIGEQVDKTDGTDLCTKAEAHICGNGLQSSAEGGFASAPLIDVGPAGVLYVLDNIRQPGDVIEQRLQRFQPSGAPIPPQAILLVGSLTFARAVAVEGDGELWVTSQGTGLRKYNPAGTQLIGPIESAVSMSELAIDAAGEIYVAQIEPRDGGGFFNALAAFDASGSLFRRFAYTVAGGGSFGNLINGLAAHTSGEFFFSQANAGITSASEPAPGPVPAPPSLEALGIGSTKATLRAEVNPEGKASEVHFEYLTQEEYEAQGNSFVGPATKETAPEDLGAEGFKLKAFEELVGCPDPASEAGLPDSPCLIPETVYRWRVVATNADNPSGGGESTAEGAPFETGKSVEIGEVWATRVGADTARLNGEVNPNSVPATGFFEYVDDATYQADAQKAEDEGKTPEEVAEAAFAHASKAPAGAPLDFGAGEDFVARQVAIFPLSPGTVYHYRLLATNPLLGEPQAGEAEELRTFTPPQIGPSCANGASRIGPGALLPDCRAYEMVSPLDKAGGDIRVLETTQGELAVHEQSSLAGDKLVYGSLRAFGDAASGPFTSQYIARRIAGEEWRTHSVNPPRGKPIFGAISQFDTEFKAFSADLCQGWLATFAEPPLAPGAQAGYSNLYRRTDGEGPCEGEAGYEALAPLGEPDSLPGKNFFLNLLGVSENGEEAVFTANDKILPSGTGGQIQLYEHVRGAGLRFVCVLPGGGTVSGSCTAGSVAPEGSPGAQIGRISSDGKRVFWSTPGTGEGKLYVRSDPDFGVEGDEVTLEVSKAAEEAQGTSKSWFWGAAVDGSAAIFTTGDLGAGDAVLYRFEPQGAATSPPVAGGVRGVMGISEDAERIYFVSEEAIAGSGQNSEGAEAKVGALNLYLNEAGGGSEFIATLDGVDLIPTASNQPYRKRTSRVSPDGGHAAFASAAPLTDYDNKGALSGQPTREIYRYDAEAEELSCASCNPSGARPAADSTIPAWQTGMHAARVLADDGSRLYFESADALAANDSNGRVDVYQWEEPGTGGCDEAAATFSPAAGGCVDLLTSGQSPQDSRFVEASPSGEDVFFATVASLLPQDFGVFDIYDARVGGGLPIPPEPEDPCEGDACPAQIPAPEEPSAASAEYVAPPEPPAGKPSKGRCAKGKRLVRRKGKSRCVAKGKPKHRRAAR